MIRRSNIKNNNNKNIEVKKKVSIIILHRNTMFKYKGALKK